MWSTFKLVRIKRLSVAAPLLLLVSVSFADKCTYETWDWDSIQRKVTKSKAELTKEELGNVKGCSVCDEDQVEIHIEQLPPIKICRVFQERITRVIKKTILDGFPISSVVGYRVGKSKGKLNSAGLRTEFSSHSYGTAIDFNIERNGLYDFCLQFGPQCKLIRGGDYRPDVIGTITRTSSLYQAMTVKGFKWGGEIKGQQKDFMHFSLTGM